MSLGPGSNEVVSGHCSEGQVESPLSPGGAAVAGGMSGFGSSDSVRAQPERTDASDSTAWLTC